MLLKQFSIKTLNDSKRLSKVVSACQELLYSDQAKTVKEYIDTRLPKPAQEDFQFGYFPPVKDLNSLTKIVSLSLLTELNLHRQFNHNDTHGTTSLTWFFEHHPLVFPIKDDFGNIISMVGRSLYSDEKNRELDIGKYKYLYHNKNTILFGLDSAKKKIQKSNKVFVVEGQIDAISCQSLGFYNTVALGGTSFSPYQLYLLKKYGGGKLKIYLLLDNDKVGDFDSQKIIEKYGSFANFERIKVPDPHKDIDEFIRKDKKAIDFLSQR